MGSLEYTMQLSNSSQLEQQRLVIDKKRFLYLYSGEIKPPSNEEIFWNSEAV